MSISGLAITARASLTTSAAVADDARARARCRGRRPCVIADAAAGAALDLFLVALQDVEGAAADGADAEQADLDRLSCRMSSWRSCAWRLR